MMPIGLPRLALTVAVLAGPVPTTHSRALSMLIGSFPDRPMRGLFDASFSKNAHPYWRRIASTHWPKNPLKAGCAMATRFLNLGSYRSVQRLGRSAPETIAV